MHCHGHSCRGLPFGYGLINMLFTQYLLNFLHILHHLQVMKIIFLKVFLICMFKDANLAENLLNCWTPWSSWSLFFQVWKYSAWKICIYVTLLAIIIIMPSFITYIYIFSLSVFQNNLVFLQLQQFCIQEAGLHSAFICFQALFA